MVLLTENRGGFQIKLGCQPVFAPSLYQPAAAVATVQFFQQVKDNPQFAVNKSRTHALRHQLY